MLASLSRLGSSLLLGLACLLPRPAAAEGGFAEPPDQPLVQQRAVQNEETDVPYPEPAPIQPSTVRVSVGPTLRVADPKTDGGLYVALDIGSRAAGVRGSGSWVRTGTEHGVSQYTAELWIDFGAGRQLHPILGAGAGVARVERTGDDGEEDTATLGIGVLRGTVEYVLPVAGVDARVGIDAIGCVPATPGGESRDARPWLLAVGHVGVGF
jgi:hypothetical protein